MYQSRNISPQIYKPLLNHPLLLPFLSCRISQSRPWVLLSESLPAFANPPSYNQLVLTAHTGTRLQWPKFALSTDGEQQGTMAIVQAESQLSGTRVWDGVDG